MPGSWVRYWLLDILSGLLSLGIVLIALFMILLAAAAAMLLKGDEEQADRLAEYAYYFLVAGVVLELIKTLREGDGEAGGEEDMRVNLESLTARR